MKDQEGSYRRNHNFLLKLFYLYSIVHTVFINNDLS